ncbi:hydrolase [Corynebacterium alimapuense]|uniref:Hydrolase n=1 Tax=Corynebacterium alimapuense TaxID=1576874 RepID=A0A3M8KB53_9CORY|nr:hydrolase [Corynebacterium alimapuense]
MISAGCAAVLLVTGTTFAATANADEVDELIAAMSEVSQEASAQNEEVKQLEIDIEAGQAELERLQADADSAQQFADSARTAEEEYQGEVNDLAGAKYRGLMVDPVINAIAASNPQNAIDRAAYLGTLTRGAEAVVDKLAEATAEAAVSHTDASRALAEASFQQSVLEQQMAELDAGQEELNERIADIEEQVNALPPADQARWEGKNSPIGDADLSSVSGSGAVSAALAKLGSPYGWGAVGPSQFDCSGLMYWAYQQQGQSIPRTSQAQLAGGTPVSRADLQPGDIVGYYPGVTHVGMYIGNGQLVHASDYGIPVQIVSVDSMPWAGAVRY